jgi:hypothetical protein
MPAWRPKGYPYVTRLSLRGLAVLLTGSAALFTTTVVDRSGLDLASGSLVPVAEAQGACTRPSMGTEDAILTAAEGYIIDSDSMDTYGYVRLQRVEGNFARVVIMPRVQTDHAMLFLQKNNTGTWKVVAGPGTAFAPEDVPGAPKAIFGTCPA